MGDIGTIIEDILYSLECYFVYFYPGFISFYVYHFVKAKKPTYDRVMIISCVIISYLYVVFYKLARDISVDEFETMDHLIMVIISAFIPYLWYLILKNGRSVRNWFGGFVIVNSIAKNKLVEQFISFFRINTALENNPVDYMKKRADKKDFDEGVAFYVYLNDVDIIYRGCIRYHEPDADRKQVIILSGYQRYIKKDGEYVLDPNGNHDRDGKHWVMLNIEDIKRIEVEYPRAK